ANLAHLESDIETHNLLYLNFEWFAGCHLETRKFRSHPVKARRDGRKGVATRFRGYHAADCVGIDIGQGNGRSRYDRTRRISHTSCNFTEGLSIHAADRQARHSDCDK